MTTNPDADALMQERLKNLIASVWLAEPHLTADAVVARISRASHFKLPQNILRGAVVEWLTANRPEGETTEDGGDE